MRHGNKHLPLCFVFGLPTFRFLLTIVKPSSMTRAQAPPDRDSSRPALYLSDGCRHHLLQPSLDPPKLFHEGETCAKVSPFLLWELLGKLCFMSGRWLIKFRPNPQRQAVLLDSAGKQALPFNAEPKNLVIDFEPRPLYGAGLLDDSCKPRVAITVEYGSMHQDIGVVPQSCYSL